MYNILYLDDDIQNQRKVMEYFNSRPYIKWFATSELRQALDFAYNYEFDLYLLELGVDVLSKFELISAVKNLKGADIPILVLSRDTDSLTKQKAFEMGVSNYLEKPVDLPLLSSVLESKLRTLEQRVSTQVHICDLDLDIQSQRCTYKGEEVLLTPTEHLILFRLAREPSTIVDKNELCKLASKKGESQISHKALEMHISCLRSKLKNKGLIQTKRGLGYLFNKEARAS